VAEEAHEPDRRRSAADTTVLIVEDDALVAEMYRLGLSRAGYDVIVAPNGEAGLDEARSASPDFIFLDIRMPRMNGLEVLGHLAAEGLTVEIPVVMLTNYDDSTQLKASLQLGAKDYLIKTSIEPGELAAIVSRWLDAR
jgi:DNA-binding response OmpR family regulator